MESSVEGQNWKQKKREIYKKETIKRMSTIFNIKTKQNQMKIDKTRRKKTIQNKKKRLIRKEGS
jgi:dolichyl-phosphate-mannose--protein O-mannosyl transferase